MSECFVFVCTNPADPIVAAKFAIDGNGQGQFIYGTSYLDRKSAFAFDPLNIPLSAEQCTIPIRSSDSFGILSDAGPNAWGKKLTASINKEKRLPIPSNPVEWLLSSQNYGTGCLGFSTSSSTLPVSQGPIAPLRDLNARVLKVIDDIDSALDLEMLRIILPGASLGGVRPKTIVIHEGAEHIAKFNKKDDLFDVSTAEYASLRLAHQAKIDVCDFELVDIADRPTLLLKRFDRKPDSSHIHYISALSLLNLNGLSPDKREYLTKFSYGGIADVSRMIDPFAVDDSKQLFRRMVFNILIGNVDDHLRNHGFLMTEKANDYRLSPAFDLLPHLEATYLPQSIGVGAYGAASTVTNALSQCERFFLDPKEARQVVDEVKAVTNTWRSVFRDSGVSKNDISRLGNCFLAAEESEKVAVNLHLSDSDPDINTDEDQSNMRG